MTSADKPESIVESTIELKSRTVKGSRLKEIKTTVTRQLNALMTELIDGELINYLLPIGKLSGQVNETNHMIGGNWTNEHGSDVTLRHDSFSNEQLPKVSAQITRKFKYLDRKDEAKELDPVLLECAVSYVAEREDKDIAQLRITLNNQSHWKAKRNKETIVFHLTGPLANTVSLHKYNPNGSFQRTIPLGDSEYITAIKHAHMALPWIPVATLTKGSISKMNWEYLTTNLKSIALVGNFPKIEES